jgi:hypothetical protein
MWSFFIFIIMEDKYTEFLIDLLNSKIRALRLKLDRSKYPVNEDEKLTSAEIASIEAEIKHWKVEQKLLRINDDF